MDRTATAKTIDSLPKQKSTKQKYANPESYRRRLYGIGYYLRTIMRNKLSSIGLIITFFVVLVAVLAPVLSPYDPLEQNIDHRLAPPGRDHLLGADGFGRDLLSRIVWGTRLSMKVGFVVVIFTTITGVAIGLVAGYYPKIDNWIIMRIMDALMAFPAIILALGIMAILQPNWFNAVIALSIVYTPRTARIVRGSVLSLKETEFVEAARALGASTLRLLFKHIMMNSWAPLMVQMTFIFAYAIIAEASLSFVGAGTPPPQPSWGNILAEGREFMRVAYWITIFPGVAIAIAVLGLNLAGDGLRDILDPRLRGSE
jgi:peptide/nickel transport system permease protein